MFNADRCVQPASICKIFPSLCLYPERQQWELLSWDQFPPVPPACQHANVQSHFPGPGGRGGVCQRATSAGLRSVPGRPRRIRPGGCSAPVGAGRFRLGRRELAPWLTSLWRAIKSSEQGDHASLLAPVMISTITTNPFFQAGPVAWSNHSRLWGCNPQQPKHCVRLSWLVSAGFICCRRWREPQSAQHGLQNLPGKRRTPGGTQARVSAGPAHVPVAARGPAKGDEEEARQPAARAGQAAPSHRCDTLGLGRRLQGGLQRPVFKLWRGECSARWKQGCLFSRSTIRLGDWALTPAIAEPVQGRSATTSTSTG